MKPKRLILAISLLMAAISHAQQPLAFRDSTTRGPQTFAMVVGISKYKFVRPLTYADKDAELFRDYLRSPGGGSVKNDNIFCLLNEEANNQNFWGKGFQWLKAKKLQRGDKLFIYLAGHGDAIDEDQFFFLGYDCNPGGDKNNYLISGAIQLFNLKKKIANETARGVDVVFIMDACRSDELPGGTDGQNFLNTAISEKKAGEIIMLATGAGQESLEDESIGNGHGLFTYYLVDGLNGAADSLDGSDQKVTFREIQTYVNKHVPAIAQQRFRRKQEPYFCCNENSEKVISSVDKNYFQQWKSKQRGPGNSFQGILEKPPFFKADTLLQETYNRFYAAVRNKKLRGASSAAEYYAQLSKKFPGNPYTLDAKSTLAVEYMTTAQKLVDDYVGCREPSERKREEYMDAASGLAEAMEYFREDDADFANSLSGRLSLLRSLGHNVSALRFTFAYAALAFDPNGAYAHNRLASLHLENKNYDSARYYADKAVKLAPNWPCALTTLSLARQKSGNNETPDAKPKTVRPSPSSGSIMVGGGMNRPAIEYNRENWRQGNSNYNDSLNSIEESSKGKIELGLSYYFNVSDLVSIRPSLQASFENGEIIYNRRQATGGQNIPESVRTETMFLNLPISIVIRLSRKNVSPYIMLAPVASYTIQNDAARIKLPLKDFSFSGEAGLGVDIGLLNSGIVLSPELKYTQGISNLKGEGSNIYLNTITSVKRGGFSLGLHIRKR